MREGDKQVIADAIRMGNYRNDEVPESADEFAQRLLHTVYMGTENRFMQLNFHENCVVIRRVFYCLDFILSDL